MFSAAEAAEHVPLAERLRPAELASVVGQAHLLGPDKPLRRAVASGRLHSMILWGPPGSGKTTLAALLARAVGARLIQLSAVLGGVKDVRAAVGEAEDHRRQGETTVLFVDEVHRFNKAQQDAFLPHVERGTLVLIGATTENPAFEVNAALLSRARVYVLRALAREDLLGLLARGAEHLGVTVSDAAAELLVDQADGDARRLYNLLEVAAQLVDAGPGDVAELDEDAVREAGGLRYRRFDKGGDAFYDQISALHKAIRGSDPDAALYWFCRMLDGGCDPHYLARRLLRLASEDVGNADPRALELTLAAWQSFDRLGAPEGELALAQAVVYLASVPKSNAVYRAFGAARAFVQGTGSEPVPLHLRNAPTRLAREQGHGEGYRYAHDEPEGYAAGENYWPDTLRPQSFYSPGSQGLEQKIAARLERLRALDRAARREPQG